MSGKPILEIDVALAPQDKAQWPAFARGELARYPQSFDKVVVGRFVKPSFGYPAHWVCLPQWEARVDEL